MTEVSIMLPLSKFAGLPASTRATILALFDDGATPAPTDSSASDGTENEKGCAVLDETDAKHFLNTCSDKTISILQLFADGQGRIMQSEAFSLTNSDDLRGAWAGLTKRVRNVTGDPEAYLINWFKKGDDWRGVMAKKTADSFSIALADRD